MTGSWVNHLRQILFSLELGSSILTIVPRKNHDIIMSTLDITLHLVRRWRDVLIGVPSGAGAGYWMLIQDPRLGWYNCADVRNVDDEYRIHRTLYNITASAVPVAVLSDVCSTGDRLGQTHWTNLNYNH